MQNVLRRGAKRAEKRREIRCSTGRAFVYVPPPPSPSVPICFPEHNTTEQRATRALMAMDAALRAVAADAVVTFLWVLCVSTLGASTAAVTSYLKLQGVHYALLVTVSLLSVLLFAFNILCDALGGASFNPTGVAAFYAAGVTSPSLFSVALRLPAQVSFHLNLGSVQFKGSVMSSERLMRTTN